MSPVDRDLAYLIGLTGLASKWREVGIHLGVPVDQLDVIQENNRGSVDMVHKSRTDMFIWWLHNGKEKTVEKLFLAVHAVGGHDAEQQMKEKYSKCKISI